MSVAEMKKVIIDKVENLSSEDELDVLLNVLDHLGEKGEARLDIDQIFKKAVNQYGSTLQKLAE